MEVVSAYYAILDVHMRIVVACPFLSGLQDEIQCLTKAFFVYSGCPNRGRD